MADISGYGTYDTARLIALAPEMAEAILAYDTPENGIPSADEMLAAERRLLAVAAKLRALTADQGDER